MTIQECPQSTTDTIHNHKDNSIMICVRIFDVMETIDDDCDTMDVVFVAVKVRNL